MAPELLDEDLSRVGPQSDVYLLGAILFEILEGFPPHLLHDIWHLTRPEDQFDAVYRAVMYNQIEENVVQRGELMQIARKAMSTEPADRYSSVEALQNALREYRITGRAEELMNSVDSKSVTDYTTYQSAVALYGEALLKWPNNRRALNGDRNARLVYAQLAQKQGDIDLGLQVVAGQTDPQFSPVIAKLKKTRLLRKIGRVIVGVTTLATSTMMILCFFFWQDAVEQKQVAVEQKTAAEDSERLAKASEAKEIESRREAEDLKIKAEQDKNEIVVLHGTAATLQQQATDAKTKEEEANRQLTQVTMSLEEKQIAAKKAEEAAAKAEHAAKQANE